MKQKKKKTNTNHSITYLAMCSMSHSPATGTSWVSVLQYNCWVRVGRHLCLAECQLLGMLWSWQCWF